MPRRASIRAHLLRLVLAVVLPLAALEAWNLYAAAQADLLQAREQVFHLAQVTASETVKFLGQAQNVLNGLAARPAVRALDSSRCDPILKDFLRLAPRFSNVVTVTIDGRVICSAVPLAGPTRVDPDILLKRMRGPDQLTVGKTTPGVITGRWAVPLGRPLLDAQGNIAGAVGLTADLLKFPVLPSLEGLPAQVVVGLISGDGTVLARSSEAERLVGTKADASPSALREKTGTAEVTGIDGIARIQGFAPVAGTDWIAIASLATSEIYAGVKARIATSALLGMAILCAALLLAVRWSRKIHEPIVAIADVAEKVAAGNLAARAPVAGAAEIAEVAAQFNAMLDALNRSNAERERLLQIIERTSDWIVTARVDGQFVYLNAAARRAAGIGHDEDVMRYRNQQFYLPERWAFVEQVARPAAIKDGSWSGETRFRAPDGHEADVLQVLIAHRDANGNPEFFSGISRDISERKRAEEALRDSEANFRTLFEQAAVGVGQIETGTGRFAKVNRRYCEIVGYTEEEMQRLTFPEITHPEDLQRNLDNLARMDRDEISGYFMEKRYIRKDGAIVWVKLAVSAPWNFGGSPFFHTAVVDDITERKRADEEIRQANERLQALSRRLLDVQESERRSIARELHDEVGGVLTAVKLNLQSLRGKRPGDAGEAALADGLALVDGAIQTVRSLSLELRPAVLDDLGLIPALKWYCERQAKRASVAIELALDAIDLKLAPQLESACFRIVQESVLNALRHANARRIKVSLLRGDVSFALEIDDDGGGFDVAAARQRGLAGESSGLHAMEERTKLVSGRLRVDSVPGAGSRVRAEFGLPEGALE